MEWTGLNELREMFLSFFESKGHCRMDSFPLIPQDDNSLLLINSGMAPLKKYFLGQAHCEGNRATTCQKCIRTPDIERVGKTARHGTFFEMLGNFSFADYFKKEATAWAWEFITQVVKMEPDKLYVSVFEDDDEAFEIWTKGVGVAEDHMVRLGREDNFWEIGSGPCGPCSEIYYDRGERYGCGKPDCAVGCDCDRYVEFWNLVFTQFISDGEGHYEKMAKGNIDTGMGLERLACICQDVDNLFEVDTIQNIMRHIERVAGISYHEDEKKDVSLRVITDHVRSTVFMVGDGIGPSNNGRGYVLRRLLRRAARHGRLLGIKRPFLFEVADTVINENITAYPYLSENREYITRVIKAEEETFAKTIDSGSALLAEILGEMEQKGEKTLAGDIAFKLNDTYGFPIDLTKEICDERGIAVDEEGFTKLLAEQKKRSREDTLKNKVSWEDDLFKSTMLKATEFLGYDTLTSEGTLEAIAVGGELTDSASEGDEVRLILDKTPFYAESGGQVGDIGVITASGGKALVRVSDTQKTNEGYFVHVGVVEHGVIMKGETVSASVDAPTRHATMRNHSSAHLLQRALIGVLGDHVHQAGSYVDPHRVRFDFAHYEAMKPEEIKRVEDIVNEKILEAIEVEHKIMSIDKAKEEGAIALFGEKYGDTVRIIDVKNFSKEFCGGTHVFNTAELGLFKILSESSVAAGIRRIEGTTGMGVLALLDEHKKLLDDTAAVFKANNIAELPAKARAAVDSLKETERELNAIQSKLAGSAADEIIKNGVEVNGVVVFTAKLAGAKAETLRETASDIRARFAASVVVLASDEGGKVTLCAACGSEAVAKGVKAGDVVKATAALLGGSGGGKPDMAMAGGKDVSKIDEALGAVKDAVAPMIK